MKAKEIAGPEQLLGALQADMAGRLATADRELHFAEPTEGAAGPNVWLFIGVNGVGKTTTIGKVAALQVGEGRSVLLPPATRSASPPPSSSGRGRSGPAPRWCAAARAATPAR